MVKLKELIKEFATIGGVVTQKPMGNGISLSKMIKKERNAAIMAAGYIDETKLPDVQRDLQMEKRRLYNERYKRK